jgi:hypothetical protein
MTPANRHRRSITLAIALLSLLLSIRTEAHLPGIGLGPVYDGIFHLLLSPEDLIPVIALALLAGQSGAGSSRRALWGGECEALRTTHYSTGHPAWLLPWILEWLGHQSLQRWPLLPFGTRSRRLRHRGALHVFRHIASPAVGADRRSRRGKLDCRQRLAHAWVGATPLIEWSMLGRHSESEPPALSAKR